MTRDEAIKYAKENILAYTSEMAEFKVLAVEALEKQTHNCADCLHAGPLQISHNTVFALNIVVQCQVITVAEIG